MSLYKSLRVCLVLLLFIFTIPLLAEDNSNRLYMNNVSLTKGSTTSVLSICLDNNVPICSFDCRLYLPEGVDVLFGENEDGEEEYFINKGVRCKTSHTVSKKKQADGSFIILLSSTTNATLKDDDKTQPVVNIVLDATNAKIGESEIILKNITINHYDAGITVPYSQEEARSLLSVEQEAYIDVVFDGTTLIISSVNGAVLSTSEYSSIVSERSPAVVDMSNAILSSDFTEDILREANAGLYYLSEGINISGKNIVTGDVCQELNLSDVSSFSTTKPFTAITATYERSIFGRYGSIMLPFAVNSDDNVEYYIPTAVENGVLVVERQETLPANTPALVARLTDSKLQAKAQNVAVSAEGGASVSGAITMYGSYVNNMKITDADAYYIKDDKFWLCNGHFFVDAFRAYLRVNASNAKSLALPMLNEITAITTLLNDADAKPFNCYDEAGRQLEGLRPGVNIMRLSNGQVIKVKR